MLAKHPIVTERLRLEPLDPDADHSRYASWLADPEVNRFLEVRFDPPPASSLHAFVKAANDSDDTLLLGIFLASGRHIGNIKIGPVEPRHRRATLGIMIGERDQWGHGFATEAIAAATDYALARLDLDVLFAGAYDVNAGSIAAFRKAGYAELARIPGFWIFEGQRVAEVMLCKERER